MPSLPLVRRTRKRKGPAVHPVASFGPREREVEAALELIRPAVREDGGDVELVSVVGEIVTIRFLGACVGCPSSDMTLKDGIEAHLVDRVDFVQKVVAAN